MPARDNDTFTADRIKEDKGGMLKEHRGKPHTFLDIYFCFKAFRYTEMPGYNIFSIFHIFEMM